MAKRKNKVMEDFKNSIISKITKKPQTIRQIANLVEPLPNRTLNQHLGDVADVIEGLYNSKEIQCSKVYEALRGFHYE